MKNTKFRYVLEENETKNFDYNMSHRKLSVFYEIAHQLKRIADCLESNGK